MERFLEFLLLILACLAGAALQWHEHFQLSSHHNVWGFLASLFPYVLCLVVGARSRSAIPAAAGAVFALIIDAIAHYDVFVRPTGLSALLSFLFIPLFSTLVFVPIVILVTRALMRRHETKRAAREQAEENEQRPRKLEPRLR